MPTDDITKISVYDLRRVPAYGFAVENVRFVLQTALELHNDRSLNDNIPRQKSLELFIKLCIEDPRPILDYRISGALHRVRLVGKGKTMKYEWSKEYFADCQPRKSPYLKDNPMFK